MYEKATKRAPAAASGDTAGEVLVSGLKADDVAFLMPANAEAGDAVATRAATDGTAWSVAPEGAYRLYYGGGSKAVRVAAHAVEKVNVR